MKKVSKRKFDAVLRKVLSANPAPRTAIKTTSKAAPKTPILAKQ